MSDIDALSFSAPGGYRDLPVEPAAANLSALRLVDVREPHEYTGPLGHIAGAELVPMGAFPAVAANWDRDRPTLLICRSGNRSGRVAAALSAAGFSRLYNLAGGMIAWNERGLPVERA